jgi:hypothetical protein
MVRELGPGVVQPRRAFPPAQSIARDSLVLDKDGVLLPVVNFDISSMTSFGVRHPRHYNASQHQLPTMCAPGVFRVSGCAKGPVT